MNKARLQVAMIIQAYLPRPGGAERQLAALTPMLATRGVDVTILTRRYPGMSRFEVINGVPVHRLPIPGPKPVASLSFTLSALLLLRRLRPDVIHAHELLSPATTAVAARRWLGVPAVAKVLRGGVLGDLAKLNNKPLGRRRMAQFRQYLDGFIVISQEIDAELAAWGIPVAKRNFIPNGVDTRRFSPVAQPEKDSLRRQLGLGEKEIALYAGRLAAEKRVDRLVTLWPRVREEFPGAELVILGMGPEQATLESMAGDGIRFGGHVEEVAPYLQAADLFVLPSATEGLSNAMLEALATGLPVIATRVGGAPDVITHRQNGWLIPADAADQEAWLNAITTLFARAQERASIGAKGRQKVAAEYGLAATAEKLVSLYGRLLPPARAAAYSSRQA